jgi:Uma2 family endonuclease
MSASEELTPIVAPARSFPARHRWTVREFQRMGETGFLDPKARLELIEADYYLKEHPRAEDVLLLIEVSGSTVRFDRKTKIPLYARHGIPEVWLVVGPRRRHIEVYRELQPDRGGYQTRLQVREGVLVPVLLPEAEIRLDALFID